MSRGPCALAFTPIESLIGGSLIGIVAAVFLLCYGRVLGFSGITGEVGSAMAAGRPIEVWKVLVLIGLVWGGIASATTTQFPFSTLDVDLTVYAAVGFLTGFGASAGNGVRCPWETPSHFSSSSRQHSVL